MELWQGVGPPWSWSVCPGGETDRDKTNKQSLCQPVTSIMEKIGQGRRKAVLGSGLVFSKDGPGRLHSEGDMWAKKEVRHGLSRKGVGKGIPGRGNRRGQALRQVTAWLLMG